MLLAAAVCFLTSVAAIYLFYRARATTGGMRALWLVTTGAATGYGVWATHFIAMLAYDPGMSMGYDLALTLISLFAAMLLTGAGFVAGLDRESTLKAALVGGAIIGLGIAVMHYIGISSLEMQGSVTWSADLVAASVVFAIVFGIASLSVALRGEGIKPMLLASAFLTLAIVGLHFTGMGAIEIVPDPTMPVAALQLSPLTLSITIASGAAAVLGISLVAALAASSRQQLIASSTAELASQAAHLQAALANMSQGLGMYDREQRLVISNAHYADMCGIPAEKVRPGIAFRELLQHRVQQGSYPRGADPDEDIAELMSSLERDSTHRRVTELPNGRFIAVSNHAMPDGGWVATHADITEQRRDEARIAFLAQHDLLTNLPNRALLHERLEHALTGMREGGWHVAVHMLDLDRFKEVNDTLGHSTGDALLIAVTERLRSCVGETDTIARLAGDEFAVVQRVTKPAVEAAALARGILEAVATPYDLDGRHVVISMSIGIAIAPVDGNDPDQLLKNADLALNRSKSEAPGMFRFFEPEMDRHMQARRSLERDLRHALMNGEFALHYQPLVNIARNEICGFEALLRWTHPERGAVAPADFIPLAEETGLIVPIGEWVLGRACADAAAWPGHIKIAVNVSVAQFRSPDFVEVVVGMLAASGVAPQRLELEVTESLMLQDEHGALALLNRLHAHGVRIALDDFGTGYSSLSSLRKFPFDKIKIDRSFVSDLSAANVDALAVVRSIAQLGVSLNIATTAEGVETEEQMDQVRVEGCTEMQGFLFSKAVPAEEVHRLFLKEQHKPVSAA
jgi:diguanylate cyclase (GGDEF)-like protein